MQVALLGDHVCRCMESPVRKLEAENGAVPFSSYLTPMLSEAPSLNSYPYVGLSAMGLGNYPQSPYSMLLPLIAGLGSRNKELLSLALLSNAGRGLMSPSYGYATGWGTDRMLNSASGFDLRL